MPEEFEQDPELEQSSPDEGGPLESGEGQGEGGGESSSDDGAADEQEPETIESLREKLQSTEAERNEWKGIAEKRTTAFDRLMSDSQRAISEAKSAAEKQRQSLEKIKQGAETWTDNEGKQWVHLDPQKQKEYEEGVARFAETQARINQLEDSQASLAQSFQSDVQGRLAKDLDSFRQSAKVTDEEYADILEECGMVTDANGRVVRPAFANMAPDKAVNAIKDIIRGRFASRNANILVREAQKAAEAKAAGKKERSLPGVGSATKLGQPAKGDAKSNLMRGILEVGFGEYAR